MGARKPFGVWVLLMGGNPWMFCREASLDEALRTARTLRLGRAAWRVWIGPAVPGAPAVRRAR